MVYEQISGIESLITNLEQVNSQLSSKRTVRLNESLSKQFSNSHSRGGGASFSKSNININRMSTLGGSESSNIRKYDLDMTVDEFGEGKSSPKGLTGDFSTRSSRSKSSGNTTNTSSSIGSNSSSSTSSNSSSGSKAIGSLGDALFQADSLKKEIERALAGITLVRGLYRN